MTEIKKSKGIKRGLGFIAALFFLAAVIFVFTTPLQAPDTGTETLKNSEESFDQNKNSFNPNADDIALGEVGKGVTAESYLIYDQETKKILASHNPNTPVAIASLTKLMTAYCTQKYGQLDDVWAITSATQINIRPILGLAIGDRVIVKDLLDAMLIGSANDAAQTLGAYLSSVTKKPAEELMNQEAHRLGMDSTHYENPIGFDSEQNYSTASDLKKLLEVILNYEIFTSIDREQSFSFQSETGKPYSVKATNTLLASDPEIHAIKTGYTEEAKGAMITSIHHENRKFIIIVLGSTDRESDTKLLKTQTLKATLP